MVTKQFQSVLEKTLSRYIVIGITAVSFNLKEKDYLIIHVRSILLTCSFQAFQGHLKHSVGVSLHLHSSVMITKGQTTTKQKNKTKEEGGKKGQQVNDFPTHLLTG